MNEGNEDPRSGKRIRRPKSPESSARDRLPPQLRNAAKPWSKVDLEQRRKDRYEARIIKDEKLGVQYHIQSMSDRYRDLMDGTLPIEDLDDEEVVRGMLRASDGTFKGRPPKAMPRDLYLKMQAEAAKRWDNKLKGMVSLSIEALERIVTSGRSEMVRYQAATYLIERTMGKTPERIQISAEVKRWEDVASSILVDLGESKDQKEIADGTGERSSTEDQGIVNDL